MIKLPIETRCVALFSDHYSKHIPINPIRRVYEKDNKRDFRFVSKNVQVASIIFFIVKDLYPGVSVVIDGFKHQPPTRLSLYSWTQTSNNNNSLFLVLILLGSNISHKQKSLDGKLSPGRPHYTGYLYSWIQTSVTNKSF